MNKKSPGISKNFYESKMRQKLFNPLLDSYLKRPIFLSRFAQFLRAKIFLKFSFFSLDFFLKFGNIDLLSFSRG